MAAPPLNAPLTIAVKDLRQRLRDRSIFIFGVIAPFMLAFIFSLLLAPLTEGGPAPEIGLVDADGSFVSAGLRTALSSVQNEGVLTWRAVPSQEEARALVEAGTIGAAVLVPEGFGAAVTAGSLAQLTVLGSADRGLAAQIADAVATSYASRLRSTSLAVQALLASGAPVPPLPLLSIQAAALPEPITLEAVQTSSRQLDPTTYYSVGMAVFFVFFIVQVGVTGLLDEERDGTMARLLVAPIARSSILAGKVLTSVVLGLISMTVMAVSSSLLMGADWGSPVAAGVLILAVVLAAAGIMSLVGGLAASPEAAGNLQSIVAVSLGALGGAFFQLPPGEGLLTLLSRLTPHYWFLRGMGDLYAGGGVASVANEVGSVLLFALVTGLLGWWLLERRLRR